MFISELIEKRACCLVCGKKIPLMARFRISKIISTKCPSCGSYMTFKSSTLLLKKLMFILILPILSFFFVKHYYILGTLAVLVHLTISMLITFTAEFKLDPATEYALKKRESPKMI